MEKKYILVSIDDERAKKISKVLGNNSCKKIIEFLSEKEASEKDIADALKMPLNTTEYNLKKLIDAELIEKTKNFFWSKKGRKIDLYKLSNKSIIISPKTKTMSKLKPILPVAIISFIGALLIKSFYSKPEFIDYATDDFAVEQGAILFNLPIWSWFLFGALFALIIFMILNWKKL